MLFNNSVEYDIYMPLYYKNKSYTVNQGGAVYFKSDV